MFQLTTFWQQIIQWDHNLFEKINNQWSNPLFDSLMPFLRNSINWAPLYLFIIVFILLNFKNKGGWWIVFFLITVALTDMTGTNVFKLNFHRIRPCNNPELLSHIRLLVGCPTGYGFTSNHAANHFGMATFMFISLWHYFKNWMWISFLWAGSIAYAQVYVGVHYPTDVAGGMLIGIFYGSITSFIFNKYFKLQLPDKINV